MAAAPKVRGHGAVMRLGIGAVPEGEASRRVPAVPGAACSSTIQNTTKNGAIAFGAVARGLAAPTSGALADTRRRRVEGVRRVPPTHRL